MIAVIDSSVAVKWYVEESGSEDAAGLIGLDLAAPDIIRLEVGNALWKKVRKREIDSSQTIGALPHLAASVKLLPSLLLADAAFELALELSHPVYDCLFLVVASELRVSLITSDERLCQRVYGSRFAEVVVPLRAWGRHE